MITIQHLSFCYDDKNQVLKDFSLSIPEGVTILFSGPSGRGKTTLLRLIMGLETPTQGSIHVPEKTKFSAVFQEDRLLPWLSILENLTLFSEEEKAKEILGELGLTPYLHEKPRDLSGGQRRRAALARALAHPFDVLVLDEPLTGLDLENQKICLNAISRIASGKTVLLASHDSYHGEALHAHVVELSNYE